MVQTPARTAETRLPAPSSRTLPRWRVPLPTPEDDAFMRALADDTDDLEESPWMSMGLAQSVSAASLYFSLHIYAETTGRDWFVASMLPIVYPWPLPASLRAFEPDAADTRAARGKKLAPDTLVARGATTVGRTTSYNLVKERGFPPFVLEVVSPTSKRRDEEDKRRAYDLLGAEEYVVFTPPWRRRAATLVGWRRGAGRDGAVGRFEAWPAERDGALWSQVLELFLFVEGQRVAARTVEGEMLRTPERENAERRAEAAQRREAEENRRAESLRRQRAEQAWAEAEDARAREAEGRRQAEERERQQAEGRRQAEAESTRLRVEIELLQRRDEA